jgi:hypothetical protein
MADGAMNLPLNEDFAARLAKKAKALGLSPETLALSILDKGLRDQAGRQDGPMGDHADNYDLDERGRDWSEVRPEMVAYLERKLADRT